MPDSVQNIEGGESLIPTSPTSPAQVNLLERRAMALALRKQGGSFRKIAEQMRQQPFIQEHWPGYSEALAHGDVISELTRLSNLNIETTLEIRQLELERLDELQARYWVKALAGDYAAADRVLSIMDRRAKYLGLHQPERYDIKIQWENLSPEQLARLAEGEDPRRVIDVTPES